MWICPVCNNDTFIYKNSPDGRLAICTVCNEDFLDDDDEEELDYE